jgi:cholinesterase
MRSLLLPVALCVTTCFAQEAWKIGQTVDTTSGHIIGQPSAWKSSVSEYLGVPFAQPPVADLRWEAPQPFKGKESTVVNATKYGPSCAESASWKSKKDSKSPQNIGAAENEQSEDCLYLNVWTKPQTGDRKKAVLIWIYGGGFVVGSAANVAYNGALLADEHDVVVVGINYRLSVLGFPGVTAPEKNPALLDQRAAVEWLRDNVERFGGDPKRMVLFGQSAGGASVDYHAFSYTKDPIIAGYIPMSGTAGLATQTVRAGNAPADVAAWSKLSQKLGCGAVETSDIKKSLKCMKGKSSDDVLKATASDSTAEIRQWGPKPDGKTVFGDIDARGARGNFVKVVRILAPAFMMTTSNSKYSPSSSATQTTRAHLLESSLAATKPKSKTARPISLPKSDRKLVYEHGATSMLESSRTSL